MLMLHNLDYWNFNFCYVEEYLFIFQMLFYRFLYDYFDQL